MDGSERLRRLAALLERFDADRLAQTKFYFAGGCRLAFALGAHRESRDLDFLCSDADGYREMRSAARDAGYRAFFGDGARDLELPREPRIDSYGIRFPVVLAGATVRVELVREARIELHPPEREGWTRAPCLATLDCYTEKLLANADRGADPDELSRDLIDLSALRLAHGPIPAGAWAAAERAYGPSVRRDLASSAKRFVELSAYRERCASGLLVSDPSAILRGVELLLSEV